VKKLYVALLLLLVVGAIQAEAGTDGTRVQIRRRGSILYRLRRDADTGKRAALARVLEEYGIHTQRTLAGGRIRHAVAMAPGHATEEALCAELRSTGAVEYAEPDYLVPPVAVPDDPGFSSQWFHSKINSPGAWDRVRGSNSILVAVCDSGVDSGHPDLAANLQLPGYNAVDGSEDTSPVSSHGTRVAGCIGAVGNNATGCVGMCWDVSIVPVRISHRSDGWAYYSDMAAGIRWAADQGAKVINLSYLAAGSYTVNDAAEYLRDRGGLLFIAAGNDGGDMTGVYPDFTASIAIGATTSSDTRSSWSNYGAFIDIVAPGSNIYTTTTSGGYTSTNGTSFASPIAAGLAALIYTVYPPFTPAQVEQIIFTTCVDLGAVGEDNVYGHGRIDAWAATSRAIELSWIAPQNTPPTAVAEASPASGEAPLEVTFDGSKSSDPDGAVVAWTWDFGDGASGGGVRDTHVYSTPGVYAAWLTVTDSRGATATEAVEITVGESRPPLPSLHVHAIRIRAGRTGGRIRAYATVTVVDDLGKRIRGARVHASWSRAFEQEQIRKTRPDGRAWFRTDRIEDGGTFTFTVTDIQKAGWCYDPAMNKTTSATLTRTTVRKRRPKPNGK